MGRRCGFAPSRSSPRSWPLVAGSSAVARAANELRYGLRLEAGVEHDSNPARLEKVEGSATPTEVTAAHRPCGWCRRWTWRCSTGGGHLFSVAVEAAGKRFLEAGAQHEDLLLIDGRAGRGLRARRAQRAWGCSVAHYDVFQRAAGAARGPRLPLDVAVAALRAPPRPGAGSPGGGGWRWFAFKPERAFDFQAPTAFAVLPADAGRRRWRSPAPSGTGASAPASRTGASARAAASAGAACPPTVPADRRRDRFLAATADVNRTGDAAGGRGPAPGSSTTRTATARACCAAGRATCAACCCCPGSCRWPRGPSWSPPATRTPCRSATTP